MKITVKSSHFHDAFRNADRSEQFSYDALEALYEYLIEIEEATGIEDELDPIAICCEYTEYANLEELKKDYDSIDSFDELERNTIVIYTK
jgi:hypothetical protein